ncbi:MAG: HD domain-containing protein [Eubacteriaceae bacterium]|nr:HD domain-containing protein [Eubacteriaceae bacterium]
MDNQNIIDYLNKNLSAERYKHTICCAELAVELAQIYGADKEKAYKAGLLHDAAKELSVDKMREHIKNNDMQVDIYMENNSALLHAYASAAMAKAMFDVEDAEILNAITYHTTGKENMTLLEKIIFIADATDESRTYDKKIEQWRDLAKKDINAAILKVLDFNIVKVVNRGFVLHENTVKARNYLVINNGK